ncbi:MAG: ABC transporter permease [Anaerolineae bacterium]|nr:MAG: ABC transporter permease [Anaerolineae bacterium]
MKIGKNEFKLEKRTSLSGWQATSIAVLAVLMTLFLFGFIFLQAGISPGMAYREIFSYAFANKHGLPLTLNRFIFLLFTTYAFILPARAGLWNIGMTGQMYAGALSAFAVLYAFGAQQSKSLELSAGLVIPLMVLASMLGGLVIGAIAGYFKGKFDTNEIVLTMMLNFILFWLVSFMIKEGGLFMNPGGRGESFELPPSVYAPLIGGVPFTGLVAVLIGFALEFLFDRTQLGYQIKAFGKSPRAARYAGIDTFKIPFMVFLLGGAIAGLAGYHYFAAVPGVYKIARNYGQFGDLAFYGIICGLISQSNPLASMPVALLFGGLSIGGRFVQGKLHMAFGVDYALLGVLMITLVAFQFFYRYRIVRVSLDEEDGHA